MDITENPDKEKENYQYCGRTGKVIFSSINAANKKRKLWGTVIKKRFRVYRCDECGLFHLTTEKIKKGMQNRNEVRRERDLKRKEECYGERLRNGKKAD